MNMPFFKNLSFIKSFLLSTGCLMLFFSCNKPIANFTTDSAEYVAPADVSFINNSKNAVSYKWDFGDGNFSEEFSPVHAYKTSGNYLVKLTAFEKNKSMLIQKRLMITPPKECLVEIETSLGTMIIQLFDATPQHRDNFLKLAEEGYFNDLLFHRVINGFMIQGGDPNSKNAKPGQQLGMGGPGYTIPAEFVDSLFHVKGAIAAARQGDQVNPQKRSSGSQFYIVQGKPLSKEEIDMMEIRKGIRYTLEQREAYQTSGGTPFLDRDYTVFGKVVKGLEIIDEIASQPTAPGDRPVNDIRMKVRIIK